MSRANEIKDRERVTEVIADVMAQDYRACSVDTLLTHPHDAIKMAKTVLKRLHRKTDPDEISEICRIALSSRKRGDLKSKATKK